MLQLLALAPSPTPGIHVPAPASPGVRWFIAFLIVMAVCALLVAYSRRNGGGGSGGSDNSWL
jgi:hypothetical protein